MLELSQSAKKFLKEEIHTLAHSDTLRVLLNFYSYSHP